MFLDSLLCTVDELVLIGPLEARLHSFVVPQLLCVIKELLEKRGENVKKRARTIDIAMSALLWLEGDWKGVLKSYRCELICALMIYA